MGPRSNHRNAKAVGANFSEPVLGKGVLCHLRNVIHFLVFVLGKKCSGANNYVFCVSEQLNIFKALNKKCKRMFLNEYFQTV